MNEKTLTVLVVDDDESVRRAMKRLLTSNGYLVQTFESAESLLKASLVLHRVCLLLDIILPGMSGLELYARLCSSGTKCPAVFMTAHEGSHWVQKTEEAGGGAFLRKPFGEQSLLSAIALACAKWAEQVVPSP